MKFHSGNGIILNIDLPDDPKLIPEIVAISIEEMVEYTSFFLLCEKDDYRKLRSSILPRQRLQMIAVGDCKEPTE